MSTTLAVSLLPVSPTPARRGILRCSSLPLLSRFARTSTLPRTTAPTASASTPGKQVRFRSSLADVRTFDFTESPSAISSPSTPVECGLPTGNRRMSRYSFENDYFRFDHDSKSPSTSTLIHSPSPKTFIKSHNVPSCARDLAISVHSLHLTTSSEPVLRGYIRCLNIAYEKHFTVKLSTDSWASNFSLSNVDHVRAWNESYDLFRFSVPLAGILRARSSFTPLEIEMCVRYSVAGQEFWDNNNGQNYHISIESMEAAEIAKAPEVKRAVAETLSSDYVPIRPALKLSFSSDSVQGLRYSRAQRSKAAVPFSSLTLSLPLTTALPIASSLVLPLRSSLSHADIIAKYCFSGAPAGPGLKKTSSMESIPLSCIPRSVPDIPVQGIYSPFASAFQETTNPYSLMHSHSNDAVFT